MLNKLNSLRDREDGFTLIELLIVVIIIGILAAIALPIFINQQKVAVDASVKSDVRNTVTNVVNAQAQNVTTAKAALSGNATTIALTAGGSGAGGTGTGSTTTTAGKGLATPTSDLTNVPALGADYTVKGVNAGGTATGAVAGYTFVASTGQFSS